MTFSRAQCQRVERDLISQKLATSAATGNMLPRRLSVYKVKVLKMNNSTKEVARGLWLVARGSMPYLNSQKFGCLLRTGSKVQYCLATFISIQHSRVSVQPHQGKKLSSDFALNLPQTLQINESYQSYSV